MNTRKHANIISVHAEFSWNCLGILKRRRPKSLKFLSWKTTNFIKPPHLKKHGCDRILIHVSSEEEFLKDVMQFLILRGHNRLIYQGGIAEFPDAMLNAKRLDLYNLCRDVSDEEYIGMQRHSFGHYIACDAVLNEEYWIAAWMCAEAHCEASSYNKSVVSLNISILSGMIRQRKELIRILAEAENVALLQAANFNGHKWSICAGLNYSYGA
ncbi:hypothetical protein L2E82_30473 [Cichorium intybus]|uniref:Uncharacterized protein n=1 Tax=Cichorium intybus TaxID=13427 RepID=A0ACB9D0M0_CICIN|nr:hypothetical protein L2E82_30473 [Cichorium intybus]